MIETLEYNSCFMKANKSCKEFIIENNLSENIVDSLETKTDEELFIEDFINLKNSGVTLQK